MENNFTNFDSAKRFIKMKREHGQESLSGPGSFLKNTSETISFINAVISQFNVKNILDLGCGDWNWFKEINLGQCNYVGWDADDLMIRENIKRYGSKSVNFEVKDIVLEDYPKVDLIICRDVLFHIQKNIASRIINKAKLNCNFLISTSFRNNFKNENLKRYTDFSGWGYYEINLNSSPFLLKRYEHSYILEKKNSKENKRYVCLYDFRDINKARFKAEGGNSFFIGLGTGRCGTVSLSKLLNINGFNVSHEHKPLLRWEGGDPITHVESLLKSGFSGDVAFYYLPYIEELNLEYCNIKFICLKRDKLKTVESYLHKTKGRNHWIPHKGLKWKRDDIWDKCFPKYQVKDKVEALNRYWDEYYEKAYSYEKKYSNFRVFDTNYLNSKEGLSKIYSFLEIDGKIKAGIKLNSKK